MAKKKLEIDASDYTEKITEVEYSEVMRKSYIDYAMSVIISRAIPDVRDGLKPVQRRVIYDMSDIGASSDRPYKKSARISGDTMGKYHPHGDSSIYDAMVVMSQDFKKGRILIDGHGNFGSIEGDGAAAMRYTEVRLEKYSEDIFLDGLKDNTVDFVPNYDESEKEPVILPCKLPNFLINGSEGIAVGMATSTPPHNVSEVIDTAVYFLDHPNASSEELLDILHGPDFPTGGIVVNKSDLNSIYESGSGKIRLRGKMVYEPGKGGIKDRLIVTELPYTMIGDGINKFLQSVADLVEDRTLPEISDILNQTSSEGVRIVFELKKGSDVEYIKNILYKKTRLEDTFGVNMLAVHDGKPETMSLRDIMDAFSTFQYEIYSRKYQTLLNKAKHRMEILEGLIRAVGIIDLIIEILRGSKTVKQSRECLVNGKIKGIKFKTAKSSKEASKLDFTEDQADAILSMPLSRLVGLELESLEKELKEKTKAYQKYEKLLSIKTEMKKEIIKELKVLKEKYGIPRKTEIIDAKPIEIVQKEDAEVNIVVMVDKFYYIHSCDEASYMRTVDSTSQDDMRFIIKTTNKSKIAMFCDNGKAHIIKTSDIPFGKVKDKGQPLDNICNYDSRIENVIGMYAINNDENLLVFLSSDGFIKKVRTKEFDVVRKTVDGTKLKDGAMLLSVQPYMENGYFTAGTKNGYYIRFKQEEIPEQKKNAVGALAIKLSDGDSMTCCIGTESAEGVLNIGDAEVDIQKIKAIKRGGKGTKTRI